MSVWWNPVAVYVVRHFVLLGIFFIYIYVFLVALSSCMNAHCRLKVTVATTPAQAIYLYRITNTTQRCVCHLNHHAAHGCKFDRHSIGYMRLIVRSWPTSWKPAVSIGASLRCGFFTVQSVQSTHGGLNPEKTECSITWRQIGCTCAMLSWTRKVGGSIPVWPR